MKIGVVSDTHIPAVRHKLPVELIDGLKGCDLILHAGDLIEMWVLEDLKKISSVEAVYGNMDSPKVKSSLPEKKILEVAGKKLCLMHGYGSPVILVKTLKKELFAEKPDIVVFGHSHNPMNEYVDGVLFFNPGSPTDTIFAPYKSYGVIEINEGKIKASIHRL